LNHNNKKAPKIFFAWWTVIITGIFSGLGHGFYIYGISVFFKDLAMELGLSRAVTSFAAGIGRLQGGISSPLTGWLADRYGPRWVIVAGVLMVGFGMILMNFITGVGSYIIAWGVLTGIGLNIGLTIAVDKALNDWFIEKRGMAQGTKFGLIGVAGVVLVPIVTWLVTWQGWRITCLLWGIMMLAGIPLIAVFVKQKRPEYYGMLPDGARADADSTADSGDLVKKGVAYASSFQEEEFTLKQALKTRAYWMLTITQCTQMTITGGAIIHIIPYLTDIGIDRTSAGSMMGLLVFFTIPARFLGGVFSDRVGKAHIHHLLACAFILQTAAFGALIVGRSVASLYLFLVLFGFSSGAYIPIYLIVMGRYFGRKAFGSIIGSSNAIRAPLALAAPVFTGWVYDTVGSYLPAFIFFVVAAALSSLIAFLIRPPEWPQSSLSR
jgi:OFA family oxalate/formate antiporter-like MFS transporter